MKTKLFFLYALLSAFTLFGSTIPTYQIAAINNRLITLDNNAVFEVTEADKVNILTWQAADTIMLVEDLSAFKPTKVVIIDGRIVICPAFYLRNLSRNNQQAASLLNVAPTISNPSTPSLTSVDTTNRIITLSDATQWRYSTQNQNRIVYWQIGQLIMIGLAAQPSSFDAVLFDGDEQSYVLAIEI